MASPDNSESDQAAAIAALVKSVALLASKLEETNELLRLQQPDSTRPGATLAGPANNRTFRSKPACRLPDMMPTIQDRLSLVREFVNMDSITFSPDNGLISLGMRLYKLIRSSDEGRIWIRPPPYLRISPDDIVPDEELNGPGHVKLPDNVHLVVLELLTNLFAPPASAGTDSGWNPEVAEVGTAWFNTPSYRRIEVIQSPTGGIGIEELGSPYQVWAQSSPTQTIDQGQESAISTYTSNSISGHLCNGRLVTLRFEQAPLPHYLIRNILTILSMAEPIIRCDFLSDFLKKFFNELRLHVFDGINLHSTGGHWTSPLFWDDADLSAVSLECHLQLFSGPEKFRSSPQSSFREGGHLSRHRGKLPRLANDDLGVLFAERRLSVLCVCCPAPHRGSAFPSFKIVVLDEAKVFWAPYKIEDELNTDKLAKSRFVVRGHATAFQTTQLIIYSFLKRWKVEWDGCIGALDREIVVEAEDIADDAKMESLMFDGSFQRSKLYFKLLQTLRIFHNNVAKPRGALDQLGPAFTDSDRLKRILFGITDSNSSTDPMIEQEVEDVKANWEKVMRYYDDNERLLLERIAAKTEEIKSLRDGLFNATSLMEASRATRMNRYIIVFTIATVLYLPPSFVATVYGTQLFNDETVTSTTEKFRNTTIALSLGTYAVAGFLLYVANRLNILRWTVTQLRALFSSIAAFFRLQFPRYFPRKRKTSRAEV
ncbi:hypothetical protein B0T19DRAFT_268969 [Cercophora scortea]|uniref:Uncharacterized protein n=1 Tax=Cercophora scortea TaxID=314031 RepID=A0AAE0I735_9PEZI|nr:hypothetical protein B0T19DRAFT_268969 [Cercophora scortea]